MLFDYSFTKKLSAQGRLQMQFSEAEEWNRQAEIWSENWFCKRYKAAAVLSMCLSVMYLDCRCKRAVMAGNSTKAYLVNSSGKKAGKSLLRYCSKCEFD